MNGGKAKQNWKYIEKNPISNDNLLLFSPSENKIEIRIGYTKIAG